MCFTSPVSFVASGALGAAGIATLSKTKRRREIPLALIPLLFGIQQFSEGILWLSFGNPGFLKTITTYIFLTFALVIWPTWMPLSTLLIEKKESRKKLLLIMLILGIIGSIFLLVFLIIGPTSAEIYENSIRYKLTIPVERSGTYIYAVITCGSLMLSSHKAIALLGFATALSFFAAIYFYTATLISTWCFFSAILSLIIIFHFRTANTRQH